MAVQRAKSFQISYKEPSIWKSYKLKCTLKPGQIHSRLKFPKSEGKGKVDLGVDLVSRYLKLRAWAQLVLLLKQKMQLVHPLD